MIVRIGGLCGEPELWCPAAAAAGGTGADGGTYFLPLEQYENLRRLS